MKRSDAFSWTDNVDQWLAMATDALKDCALRICVTTFVCKRLPQGMPVSPEDARSQAREARIFLKTLFQEVEHGGKKIQG